MAGGGGAGVARLTGLALEVRGEGHRGSEAEVRRGDERAAWAPGKRQVEPDQGGRVEIFRGGGGEYRQSDFKNLKLFEHPAAFVRREILEKFGGFKGV